MRIKDTSVDTYRCEACGGEFKKGWSDEEAMEESARLFPLIPEEQLETICDDCFQRYIKNEA